MSASHRFSNTKRIRTRVAQTKLDSSDIATILAALRLFQREYEDLDAMCIADAWPMHFSVEGEGDDAVVKPEPLGSIDIDGLCERINCAKSVVLE